MTHNCGCSPPCQCEPEKWSVDDSSDWWYLTESQTSGENDGMTGDEREKDIQGVIDELTDWWSDTAHADVDAVARKAAEYGSVDLELMGAQLLALNPDAWSAAPADERRKIGMEMACAFYASGKIARLVGAYQQGRIPSDDTWSDLVAYAMMARRIRTEGMWP